MAAEPDYFLDNYGRCALDRCACLTPDHPWLGRACINWRPLGARSFAGLLKHARSLAPSPATSREAGR